MSGLESWSRVIRVGGSIAAGACLGVWALAAWADSNGTAGDPDVAARTQIETTGFLYREIQIDDASARTGDGHEVSLQGQAVTLHGKEIAVGDTLRAATLQDPTLQNVAIAGKTGRVRILSVVPSLQTPTCEQQTHYLSEKNAGLSERVELVTISLDAPEIQRKFAQDAQIENVTFLSDIAESSFGRAHGLLIEKPRILTRAVMVIDAENVVRYLQVVPEVSHMPDLEAAFAFARTLVAEDRG